MSRKYLKRAMTLLHEGHSIRLTPYIVNGNGVDADGDIDNQPFDSLNELMAIAQWTQPVGEAFITRINEILAPR